MYKHRGLFSKGPQSGSTPAISHVTYQSKELRHSYERRGGEVCDLSIESIEGYDQTCLVSIEGVEALIRHDETCHVSIEGVETLIPTTI